MSQLRVQTELPLVDTAVPPLLHTMDRLHTGPLQVLHPEGALGLLLLPQGLWVTPGKKKANAEEPTLHTIAYGPPDNPEAHALTIPILERGKLKPRGCSHGPGPHRKHKHGKWVTPCLTRAKGCQRPGGRTQ